MESKWAEVAAMFGLQLEEEFDLKDDDFSPYRFTERGLFDKYDELQELCAIELINGEWERIIKRFKPEKEENYWYISVEGYVFKTHNTNTLTDYYRISSGNCFRTSEEAEAHVEAWEQKYKEFFND